MRRVFLDTNVLLDIALEREYRAEAEKIWELADKNSIDLFATALSYANAAYIMRHLPLGERYARLLALTQGVVIIPLTESHIFEAIAQPTNDFEDMLQYQCARTAGCDVIVSNNTKDFKTFSALPVMTSREFLTTSV